MYLYSPGPIAESSSFEPLSTFVSLKTLLTSQFELHAFVSIHSSIHSPQARWIRLQQRVHRWTIATADRRCEGREQAPYSAIHIQLFSFDYVVYNDVMYTYTSISLIILKVIFRTINEET